MIEYPQLRGAQTRASGRLPGTPVPRISLTAHGDAIYATHVAAPSLVPIRTITIGTAADTATTESGGISA